MPPRPKSGYIPTLDGWRAIAVGLVVFCHAPIPEGHLASLQPYGALGVDLFFAISGLLICSRLLEEERRNGCISLRGFYIRRSFRIFPAAYLYLAVVAVLALLHILPNDWAAWGSATVFLRNYFLCLVRNTADGRFTEHFWSLAIEEHFYLLLPSLLILFSRRRKTALLFLTVAAFVWLGVYLRITPSGLRSIEWERRSDLRAGSLLLPALLALFLAEERSRAVIRKWVRPITIATLLCVVGLALILKHHFVPSKGAISDAFEPIFNPDNYNVARGGPVHLFASLVVPVLFPFLILSTVLHPDTIAGRILECRPMRSLGRISYSVYLWQQLTWTPHPSVIWPIRYLERPLIALPVFLALSLASYFAIEKPLIRIGHRLAPPPTPGHRDLEAKPDSISQSVSVIGP